MKVSSIHSDFQISILLILTGLVFACGGGGDDSNSDDSGDGGSSGLDEANAVSDTGSVRLINGLTGAQIGTALVGGSASELVGYNSVTALPNGNYVVASGKARLNNAFVPAPIRLMSGVTGLQIGTSFVGTSPFDTLGSGGVIPLLNNNFVVLSPSEVPPATSLRGTIRLIDGTTGALVRLITSVDGLNADNSEIRFGSASGVTALTNNNFVYSAGAAIYLVNGDTGVHIGSIAQNSGEDRTFYAPLANNNYAITGLDVLDPIGLVRTIDDTSNVQIGIDYTGPIVGLTRPDNVGIGPVTALTNGNYLIGSQFSEINNISQSGAVSLVDSDVPALIGTAISGDNTNDQLSGNGITALSNGHYVVSSSGNDVDSINAAGSVFLVNGTTGVQIGTSLAGNNNGDQVGFANDYLNGASVTLGLNGSTALANDNYVVASSYDTENGISAAGSVRLMNGSTGEQIGVTIAGEITDDLFNVTITGSSTGAFFVMAAPLWDNSSNVDSGMVRLIAE